MSGGAGRGELQAEEGAGKRRREVSAVRVSTALISLGWLSIWIQCCIILILLHFLHRSI